MIQEDKMEKRKAKRRTTGTAKDDFELNQSPPGSPLLAPSLSHLTPSLEAPSQLQASVASPQSSRPTSPMPSDTPCLIPLPPSRPSSPTQRLAGGNVAVYTMLKKDVIAVTINLKDLTRARAASTLVDACKNGVLWSVKPRRSSSWGKCPPELLLHIFEALRVAHPSSLIACSLVNREWNAMGMAMLRNIPKLTRKPRRPSSCARCPPELLLHIFEILRAVHQPSLFACTLVNREWNAIGTTVLWSVPKFTHTRSLDKFIRTLEQEPSDTFAGQPSVESVSSLSTATSSTQAASLSTTPTLCHPYATYVRRIDLTHLTEHDRNNSALSSHLLRLLPIIHNENLQTLNLSFVKGITNSYLTKLLSPFFMNVRTLNLAGGSRSDACVSAIIPYCCQVQHLSLAWNTSLSDSTVVKIASHCGSRLRTLDLTNCEKVSDRALSAISQHCVKLRELRVSYCRGVGEDGVREVIESCETLNLLDLVGCLGVDRGFLLRVEFGLARRGLRIIWKRMAELSGWDQSVERRNGNGLVSQRRRCGNW